MEAGFPRQVIAARAASLSEELSSLQAKLRKGSIHNTRVASRRMRAALEAFKELFPSRPSKALYEQVKQITRLLGKTRETEVNLSLLKELDAGGDMAENLCREYLQERFATKLRKGLRRLKKSLRFIDLESLQTQTASLLGELPAAPMENTSFAGGLIPSGKRPRNRSSLQPSLFDLSAPPPERAARVLSELAEPILSFRPQDFGCATDQQIHELRIAAKKLRYALEVFDPVWPAGLKKHVSLSRALQDAGGQYHDWCVLRDWIQKEIGRLTRRDTPHFAFQMDRLLEQVEERRVAFRKKILPALSRLQKSLSALLPQAPRPAAQRVGTRRSRRATVRVDGT